MQAILGNAAHPEYGVVTIPFPLPREEYNHSMEILEALEIGDAVRQDCKVEEILGGYPVLKRLEGQMVNADELDYLAKRLDSFCEGEDTQFQAMAEKLHLTDIRDFINLSFCCQQATVITDFSDLEKAGKEHYMNLRGGHARKDELDKLDGEETARQLIGSENGTVTPYGVVYDNGMELAPVYDGQHLPCYYYEPAVMTLALSSRQEPEDPRQITWLYLPTAEEQIKRALLRSGIAEPEDFFFRLDDSVFPDNVEAVLDVQRDSIYELNRLAQAAYRFRLDQWEKLSAVAELVKPENTRELRQLAENLELFEFIPDVRTPEEYGRYMIRDSGHFDYDPNLDGFYDYEKYGLQRMAREQGCFTEQGYLAYQGEQSLEALLREEPEMQMGGW